MAMTETMNPTVQLVDLKHRVIEALDRFPDGLTKAHICYHAFRGNTCYSLLNPILESLQFDREVFVRRVRQGAANLLVFSRKPVK